MTKRQILKRIVWTLVTVLVLGYVGILGWFKLNEARLVYYPTQGVAAPSGNFPEYQTVEIPTSDSIKLACLEIPAQPSDSIWVLFFHGNGGNVMGYRAHYAVFHELDLNVLAVDYRGYGNSQGKPGETGLYLDAEACYNYLRTVRGIPPERIIIFGYSLGSAVAIDLASKEPAAGLVVEGAFKSIPSIGQGLYPFIPINLLAGQRFESIDKIGRVGMPKLFIHAVDDDLIPLSHGRALYEKAGSPKQFLEVTGGHNSAFSKDAAKCRSGLGAFVRQISHK
jgi:uncharacterized protein